VPHAEKNINKPVLCSFMGIVDVSEGIKHLEQNGIPNYAFPEEAVRAMASMVRFTEHIKFGGRNNINLPVNKEATVQFIKNKLADKDTLYLGQKEANQVLDFYGFPTLKSRLVTNPSQIAEALEDIGAPVVMKISSPDIIHKFDAGGVILKIKNSEEALTAYNTIINNAKNYNADARIEGVLMEKMAKKGVEVILGAFRDPKFGPMCMFGLGGTFVEALKDVTFRLAPMWQISAERMIRTIKAYKILCGVRGNPPSDIEAIKESILRLSQLVSDHPEIAELDINPLIVYPEGEGCAVADSRILLKKY
jgi:acyl-CoA synthetase (NDP forming)